MSFVTTQELINRRLIRHVKYVHEGVQYSCDQCDYKETQKSHLQQRVKSFHEKVKYSCELCEYEATQKLTLKIHVESLHEGVRYSCKRGRTGSGVFCDSV